MSVSVASPLVCCRDANTGTGNAVMELHEIRYFLALSKTLNFTKAAEMCNVSQPALTRAIQKMEDELGGLLFSRERGNTHLTELGRMLEPHLREVLDRTHAAKETRIAFPAPGQCTTSARCHVHHRAGALRQLPQPVSCRQSGNGDYAEGGGSRSAVRFAGRRANWTLRWSHGPTVFRRRCSRNRSTRNGLSSPAPPATRLRGRMP